MSHIAEEMRKVDLFKEVELADLDYMIEHMTRQTFTKGTVLFEAGDPGDTMYIIRNGRIRIFIYDVDGSQKTFRFYGVNQVFGELSPIDQRPRSASAEADEDLDTLTLSREHFLELLDQRPQIGLAMMRSLADRLRYTTQFLEEARQPVMPDAPTRPGISRQRAQAPIAAILDKIDAETSDSAQAGMLSEAGETEVMADAPTPPPSGTAFGNLFARMANQGGGSGKSIFDRIAEREKDRAKDKDA